MLFSLYLFIVWFTCDLLARFATDWFWKQAAQPSQQTFTFVKSFSKVNIGKKVGMPKPEVEAKKKDNPKISQASPSYDHKPENGKMVKVSEIILTSTSPRKA